MKDKLTALVVEGRITVNDLRTIENAFATVAEQASRIAELEEPLRAFHDEVQGTADQHMLHLLGRIAELEVGQRNGHVALTQQIAENAELKRKLANHAARLGTALKTRSELLCKLRERDARIAELQEELDTWIHTNAIDVLQRRVAELEAEAGVDRALLALADARLNREVLKTKGGV